ncbi:hypothetical protein KI387_043294 [Taxus chinensis]|uniref:Uncharacterized protein n=1 Tax=Taxus chinensis TaxID=29808 RepID=A0AA38BZD1_TAXCH|nr:hypothetical protein KI387_043294 [Taxus chinensis]
MGRLNLLEHLSIESSGVEAFPIEFGRPTSLDNLRKIDLNYAAVSRISLHGNSCPSLETLHVDGCGHLTEIETLPTALKFIELSRCRMLKNIRGIGVLLNLQRILIHTCPELNEIPSLAGLVSLKDFEIMDCPKIEKVEGLQHLRSLEMLKARTRWKEPGIESFEQVVVRLRRVEVVADNRLALQPCLQIPIQKWPCEMIVCGRAAHDACSTLDSLNFPGFVLNLVESNPWEDFDLPWNPRFVWPLKYPKTDMSNARIRCFIIHSDSGRADDILFIDAGKLHFSMAFERGTWVVIGVYAQGVGEIRFTVTKY